jgi:hypothetical protein
MMICPFARAICISRSVRITRAFALHSARQVGPGEPKLATLPSASRAATQRGRNRPPLLQEAIQRGSNRLELTAWKPQGALDRGPFARRRQPRWDEALAPSVQFSSASWSLSRFVSQLCKRGIFFECLPKSLGIKPRTNREHKLYLRLLSHCGISVTSPLLFPE